MNYRMRLGQKTLKQKKIAKQKLGFSLLELSSVMIIISILVGAISQGSRILSRSRLAGAQTLTKSSSVTRIPNLLAWYETTMNESFIDSEASQGAIGTWFNLNPTNRTNNATQTQTSSPDRRPVLIKNTINGLPSLVFDGVDDFLSFDGTALANTDYTVLIVEARTGSGGQKYMISGNGLSLTNQVLSLGYQLNTRIVFAQLTNNQNITVPGYTTQTTKIHTFRFGSSIGKNYYSNGINLLPTVSDVNGKQGLVSYINAQIGGHFTSNFYLGNIGEIIIFTKYLNDDERKDVERYLGKKWGVTI